VNKKLALWVLAIGFSLEQNCYFGWNFTARSDAELIADGIGAVLLAIAVIWGTK
jgi:hypothetical protein